MGDLLCKSHQAIVEVEIHLFGLMFTEWLVNRVGVLLHYKETLLVLSMALVGGYAGIEKAVFSMVLVRSHTGIVKTVFLMITVMMVMVMSVLSLWSSFSI